jgi:RNA polymerase sigma factor (sigma-70 family)
VNNNSNQKKLKEWITKYTPKLKSFIRGQISSRDDADDILQDVFYQLAKNVDNAMNPIENISAWLYRVTQNKIINAETKKKEVRMPVFQEDEDENVLEEIIHSRCIKNIDRPKGSKYNNNNCNSKTWYRCR